MRGGEREGCEVVAQLTGEGGWRVERRGWREEILK